MKTISVIALKINRILYHQISQNCSTIPYLKSFLFKKF